MLGPPQESSTNVGFGEVVFCEGESEDEGEEGKDLFKDEEVDNGELFEASHVEVLHQYLLSASPIRRVHRRLTEWTLKFQIMCVVVICACIVFANIIRDVKYQRVVLESRFSGIAASKSIVSVDDDNDNFNLFYGDDDDVDFYYYYNGACSSHADCSSDGYCDYLHECWGCGYCWFYNDSYSGSCPSNCDDTSIVGDDVSENKTSTRVETTSSREEICKDKRKLHGKHTKAVLELIAARLAELVLTMLLMKSFLGEAFVVIKVFNKLTRNKYSKDDRGRAVNMLYWWATVWGALFQVCVIALRYDNISTEDSSPLDFLFNALALVFVSEIDDYVLHTFQHSAKIRNLVAYERILSSSGPIKDNKDEEEATKFFEGQRMRGLTNQRKSGFAMGSPRLDSAVVVLTMIHFVVMALLINSAMTLINIIVQSTFQRDFYSGLYDVVLQMVCLALTRQIWLAVFLRWIATIIENRVRNHGADAAQGPMLAIVKHELGMSSCKTDLWKHLELGKKIRTAFFIDVTLKCYNLVPRRSKAYVALYWFEQVVGNVVLNAGSWVCLVVIYLRLRQGRNFFNRQQRERKVDANFSLTMESLLPLTYADVLSVRFMLFT